MKKFILLYKGPATPMDQMSEEQNKTQMQAWQAWAGKAGSGLVDMGSPMANGSAVVDDGSSSTASDLNGYSIIQAEDMNAAKAMLEGHPFLSDKSGKFSIEVFELVPIQM
ncbi:MAG TPA: YciI family protein [Candidatus Sulfotelmatobacter sp.]|nr:YciI family protein [Candidatus Sulfotelmatobacter sp.]